VSGSLAERTFIDTYIFFSLTMTAFIFPVASAWAWGGGWLQEAGFHDFAGSGVVHMLGGVGGLVGTIILGPRLGMFKEQKPKSNKVIDANIHNRSIDKISPDQKQRSSKSKKSGFASKRSISADSFKGGANTY